MRNVEPILAMALGILAVVLVGNAIKWVLT